MSAGGDELDGGQVPDGGLPPPGSYDDDLYLGGEASVPEGVGGGTIRSSLPETRKITGELRELERRMRERLSPVFTGDPGRRLPLEFLWKRYRRFAMRDRSEVVDPYGRDPVFASRHEPLVELLYSRYFRVAVDGIEHIPASGPALLVANHSGALPWDALVLMHAVRREHPQHRDLRPLIEDAVFHFPYLGLAINRMGGVRACPENAERLLAERSLVGVFPEGIKGLSKLYRDRKQLERFGRGGFVRLALRAGVPVIPVAILGAEDSSPLLGRVTWFSNAIGLPYLPITPTFPLLGPAGLLPLPAKWRVRFAPPLAWSVNAARGGAEDRLLVSELADGVRSQLQSMVDEMRSDRKSTLFG